MASVNPAFHGRPTEERTISSSPSRFTKRPARQTNPRRLLTALVASAALLVGSLGVAHAEPATDDATALDFPADFKAPFECGLRVTYSTYQDHDFNALDIIRADGGQDLGTPILASAPGTARLTEGPGAGLVVNIDHEGGWQTRHYHLDTRTVEDGQRVEQGQQVGTMGNTGVSSGPHLHYEQRLNGTAQEIVVDGEELAPYPFSYHEKYFTSTNGCDGEQPPVEKEETSLAYTGPEIVSNGESAELSGTLTDEGDEPVADRTVSFTLGTGDSEQACEGTTGSDGGAMCVIDTVDQPLIDDGTVPLRLDFAGDDEYEASSHETELRITLETELEYTGPASIANDTAAELSGTLIDETGAPVTDQTVAFTLGAGDSEQVCEGTTTADGAVTCTVEAVDQPLTDETTVPVSLTFDGDGFYLPSEASAEVLLEYVTGSAFGLSADIPVLGLPISIGPAPESGEVRTAHAEETEPSCLERLGSALVTADVLCAQVVSDTDPTAATASANVSEARIGLAGLSLIELSGVEVASISTCEEQVGSVDMTLKVAGVPIEIGDTPDLEIDVDLGITGARLVVNEQIVEEDGSLTVNGARLTAPGGIDVVVGSATSAAHNCA